MKSKHEIFFLHDIHEQQKINTFVPVHWKSAKEFGDKRKEVLGISPKHGLSSTKKSQNIDNETIAGVLALPAGSHWRKSNGTKAAQVLLRERFFVAGYIKQVQNKSNYFWIIF